jgi:Tfp pilus assembly protein PilX
VRITRFDFRSERGFTMVAVMVVMAVATILASGALMAAQSDLPFSKASSDRKQAFAAAEAGVEYYLHQLTNDNDYWTRCANVPSPAPINQKWNGVGSDQRKWRTLAGTSSQYTIELLPANGPTCVESQAETTMLDQTTGTLKIRATGRAGKTTRSIIAEFRRDGFLDFLYFTDFETFSPEVYASSTDRDEARLNCAAYRDFRPNSNDASPCAKIQFISDHVNRGPFHTNDDILACGNYTLGRNSADSIEIAGPHKWQTPGTSSVCAAGDPNVQGTLTFPAKRLDMPSSNAALEAQADVVYTGRTTIYLHDGVMDVTTFNTNAAGTTAVNQPLPANGVIYVRNGSCATTQTPLRQSYNEPAGCANVTVYGTYSRSLTIASQKDIIVGAPVNPSTGNPIRSSGDLVRSGNVVLGLIADKFVRVSHAVDRSVSPCVNRKAPDGKWTHNITIDAAMLSLAHSFIVDNHDCGEELGTLTVKGAIAQKYRGPVGETRTSSGVTTQTGFTKAYEYDDRFRYRSPPFFLNPVDAAWNVMRENEQVPATK